MKIKDSNTTRLCFYLIIAIFSFLAAGAIAQTITDSVVNSDTTTIRSPGQNVGDPAAYSKPNQSRIWYNSHQNRWDALIPKDDNNGGVSASDHFILKDVSGLQEFTAVELEDRDFARPDVFWNDAGTTLYVLASHPVESQFWRAGYDIGTDTYSIEVGQLGTGVAVPGITHPNNTAGGNSPATLYVTPNGEVWVAVLAGQGLQVQHSNDGGANWLASPVTLDASAVTGVTTWIDFSNGGQTFAGVFAGENGEGGSDTDFFFWFIDQNADPMVFTNWANDSPNIPPPFGAEQSDDHVSAAKDSSGNQYFAVKTESGNATDPLINLYKRTPGGVWSQFKVTETQDFPEESRPSIVIDDDNAEINIFTNGAEAVSSTERVGNRISTPLNSLEGLASAPITPIFSVPGKIFTDIITPRSSVNANSGIAVLAHNRTDNAVWFSFDEAQSGTLVPNVVGLSQAAAQQAIVSAGLAVGAISRINNPSVPAGTVISQSPGESIRDNFGNTSFSNNDGSINWAGSWIEVDGAGFGPNRGNARIEFGELSLDDRPNTGGQPSLARQANLSNFGETSLSFNFRTTSRVDRSDSVVVEISRNGGSSWTVLENLTGISGTLSASRRFDISAFASTETQIRYRVNNLYGGFNEKFLVDYVEISLAGIAAPEGSPVDLLVSSGPVQGDDDDDDDDD